MNRFRFTVEVDVMTTPHIARRIQEMIAESLEDIWVDERYEKIESKVYGMTVEVTPVRKVKPQAAL